MITLTFVYILAGLTFALFAGLGFMDRSNPKRFGNAAFWGLLALSMLAGDYLGDFGNGLLVLALVAIAGAGQIGRAPGGEVPAEVQAERAVSRAMGGSCSMPLAAHATWAQEPQRGLLVLDAALGDAATPTRPLLKVRVSAAVADEAAALALGAQAVQQLHAAGAAAYLPAA